MKQVRLSKQNIESMESLGFLTSDEINWHISKLLSGDVHECTPTQKDLLPSLHSFFSSIEESLAVIACHAGRVWQRTLEESPVPIKEKTPELSQKQRDWVNDLVTKTLFSMSDEGDRNINGVCTRNVWELYNKMWGPADLYNRYVADVIEWIEKEYDIEKYTF